MNSSIEQMLKHYEIESSRDQKNAVKEIMQEIVLCGLSRAGFFDKAAFYGGTALRIFYGLDRFSEDLAFSLDKKAPEFDLSSYLSSVEKEVRAFGLNVEIREKKKTKESGIRSAFHKGSTREHLLLFHADERFVQSAAPNESIRIKLEVDVDPPEYAGYENKFRLLPVPYKVRLYDMPSLFAGKIHAVLCRAWKNRVKGRDLYDYVFYLSRGAAVNLKHLRERLIESGAIPAEDECSLSEVKEMLIERFNTIDFAEARRDIEPFVSDTGKLDIWSAEFFREITKDLKGL